MFIILAIWNKQRQASVGNLARPSQTKVKNKRAEAVSSVVVSIPRMHRSWIQSLYCNKQTEVIVHSFNNDVVSTYYLLSTVIGLDETLMKLLSLELTQK